MSYLVLARKYRPRNFAEMVGQGHVVQALVNALQRQRLHHAYLFTGTRGVGKTTVARILAKSLNCQGADGQGGITAEPCGVCPACQAIDAGRFKRSVVPIYNDDGTLALDHDEHPRPGTTMESLASPNWTLLPTAASMRCSSSWSRPSTSQSRVASRSS